MKKSMILMVLSAVACGVLVAAMAYGADYFVTQNHLNRWWLCAVALVISLGVIGWSYWLGSHLAEKDFAALWNAAQEKEPLDKTNK